MRVVAALILLIGVAASRTTSHLRATPAARPADEEDQDFDESSEDTNVPVEVEETDNTLPTEDVPEEDSSENMDSEMDAEHNQLVEELEKSKQLKKNLAQTSRRAQEAVEEFHSQEQKAQKVEKRLQEEQRGEGELVDELNKVGRKAAETNKKLKKTESMFEAEQRKNGELMDELRVEQLRAQRKEQNQAAKEHQAMETELQKTKQELAEARTHESELQKKVTDLEHAKDLWKSAAVSARKAIKDQKAAKVAKAKKAVSGVDHAILGKALANAHAAQTTPTKQKRLHKEIEEPVAHEAVSSNASQVAAKNLEHVEKPVVQVSADASSEYGDDDISIIAQADDPPLEEAPVQVTTVAASVQNAPAVQSKSDADAEEDDEEIEEEE